MHVKTYQGVKATYRPSKFVYFKYRHACLHIDHPLCMCMCVQVAPRLWKLVLPTGKRGTIYQPINSFLALHEFLQDKESLPYTSKMPRHPLLGSFLFPLVPQRQWNIAHSDNRHQHNQATRSLQVVVSMPSGKLKWVCLKETCRELS